MKTTLDIADALLIEVKTIARRDGTTMRVLVEEGLRTILVSRKKSSRVRTKMRTAVVTNPFAI